MSDRYQRLLLGLAAAHLTLVMLGAAHVDLSRFGPLGRGLAAYSALSGADSTYGFFASEVIDQLEANFELVDRSGNRTTTSLVTGTNREADLLINNITLSLAPEDPELRRKVSASLAGKLLAQHPEAVEVVLRVDRIETVSIEEYRSGSRPERTTVYTARFKHEAP